MGFWQRPTNFLLSNNSKKSAVFHNHSGEKQFVGCLVFGWLVGRFYFSQLILLVVVGIDKDCEKSDKFFVGQLNHALGKEFVSENFWPCIWPYTFRPLACLNYDFLLGRKVRVGLSKCDNFNKQWPRFD